MATKLYDNPIEMIKLTVPFNWSLSYGIYIFYQYSMIVVHFWLFEVNEMLAFVCSLFFSFINVILFSYVCKKKYFIMNEHRINDFSEIKGKLKTYTPFDFVESIDTDYAFIDCIAVFSEPIGCLTRMNFKVDFYKEFNKDSFINDTDRTNHTVYLINSKETDSLAIINDIQQGEFFQS